VDNLRRELLQQRFAQAESHYVARLRQGAKVVTIFDVDAAGQPARVARLPRMASAVLENGVPTPATPRTPTPAVAPTGVTPTAAAPTDTTPVDRSNNAAAPAAGLSVPAPATSQVIPAAPLGIQGNGGPTSGVRPATMLEVGEKVRQGVHLESTQAPHTQRLQGGPSNIPNRRPSAAVTGPSTAEWRTPANSAMMGTGNSAVR